jgi:hypothetical protein
MQEKPAQLADVQAIAVDLAALVARFEVGAFEVEETVDHLRFALFFLGNRPDRSQANSWEAIHIDRKQAAYP